MTPKEKLIYALSIGAGAAVATYVTMGLREHIETMELG